MRALRLGAQIAIIYLSVGIALASFRYVTDDPALYDSLFRSKYISHLGVVWLHGVAATVALALGPLQFWTAFRLRYRVLHRCAGMIYLVCIACAGFYGLDMALDAYGGVSSRVGFVVMDLLWLGTGWLAWTSACHCRFGAHRRWMFRNFALTFAAVTMRLYLVFLQDWGWSFSTIYPLVTWIGWIPNLLLVEFWLGRRKDPP